MGINVKVLGGDSSQLTFSDTFARADIGTWGSNWMRTLSNTPGGGGNGATGVAEVSSSQGVITGLGGVGATQFYQPTWIPLPVFSNLYRQAGVFVQYTFKSTTGANAAAALRYNHDQLNTITQTEGTDNYIQIFNGRIDKVVGGGAQGTIGAATWVIAANDVIRFEVLTVNASTVRLQSIRNGAILQTIDDTSATRILQGGPGFQMNSLGASLQNFKITNFSCGPLTALSV